MAKNFNIFMLIEDYIWNPTAKFFSSIGDWITKLPGRLWEWLKNADPLSAITSFIGNLGNTIYSVIYNAMPAIVQKVMASPKSIAEQAGEVAGKAVNAAVPVVNSVASGAKTAGTAVSGAVTTGASAVASGAKAAGQAVGGVVDSAGNSVSKAASDAKKGYKEAGGPDGCQCKCVSDSAGKAQEDIKGNFQTDIIKQSNGDIMKKVFNENPTMPDIPAKSGLITSEFGPRNTGLQGASKFHKGIDMRAGLGEPIESMWGGKVIEIDPKWGTVAVENDNGYISSYTHLSKMNARVGDSVKKGDVVGLAGKTGPIPGMASHLHLSVKDKDGSVIDPKAIFAAAGEPLSVKKSLTESGGNDGFKIKDSLIPPSFNKKSIGESQSSDQIRQTNALIETVNAIRDTTEKMLTQSQQNNTSIINNVTTSMNSTVRSMSNSIARENSRSNKISDAALNASLGNVG
jgi:murein DD-endopeptidase MepM/ murein hydrolase activator NlpD